MAILRQQTQGTRVPAPRLHVPDQFDGKYAHGTCMMRSTFHILLFTILYRVKTRPFLIATKNRYRLLEDPRGQRGLVLDNAFREPAARRQAISAKHTVLKWKRRLTV